MLPRLVLTPLESLPGWMAVHEPSVLEFLVVILGVPAAIAAVFVALVMGPAWWRNRSSGI
ncbi:MAG: hypothetical protein VB080_08705 [Propionicimonas sp.]|uniref:hypothetical protein n=1 Tax=Propionicimonas sp. TaxID=1955623 RepID=UPI002B211FC1|nr:hypothetical protein [Propionicimonas sp.]MEA4944504.1 hypothetical protein [Propionicimonas sp.]MEA5118649.1 hypothetical protein [Propionicimonas sp.]